MKPIRLTKHALEQCEERGATQEQVFEAVINGVKEPAEKGRLLARLNFQFSNVWNGNFYPIKQVAPVFIEEEKEIVVITVYTFYF